MRIVSLVPSITELIVALGAEDSLVGVTKFCVHPAHLRQVKQVVGGTKNVQLERVRALKPDLVIANKEENVREQVEQLAMEFPVYISDVYDVTSALQMIRETGLRIGYLTAANLLAETIENAFQEPTDFAESKIRKRAAYFVWNDPYMAAGGGTYIDDMLTRAGFDNVFSTVARYPQFGAQDLQELQVQTILLSTEPFPFTEKHCNIIREQTGIDDVRLVDGEMFSWYGSRMLQAAGYFRQLATRNP